MQHVSYLTQIMFMFLAQWNPGLQINWVLTLGWAVVCLWNHLILTVKDNIGTRILILKKGRFIRYEKFCFFLFKNNFFF